MFVTSVTMRRQGYFGGSFGTKADPSKPFEATIEVHGQHGKVELRLSPDLSARIVGIVADEIAAAGRATAEALTASCLNALPSPEAA